jgi:hypothetical protein
MVEGLGAEEERELSSELRISAPCLDVIHGSIALDDRIDEIVRRCIIEKNNVHRLLLGLPRFI